MTHLTRDELDRWWRSGQPTDRSRIVGHLAECDECAALYADVIESRPVAATELPDAPADLVARAHRLYGRQSGAPRAQWRWWTVGTAAAAILVAAIAIQLLRQPSPRGAASERDIRGSVLQLMAPIGTVAPPVHFRWASPVAAERFVVEVRDDDERLVLALSSASEAVPLPEHQRAQLLSGRTYQWQVIAVGPGGDEIMRSPSRSFEISGR
ncbi:MAG: hypothetical protein ACRD26_19265 [Vicinamibacterales bacterium]